MVQRNRFNHKRQKPRAATPRAPVAVREAPVVYEKKPPTEYGKPFILMEDEQKNTFEYKAGAWVPHSMSIAERRHDCLVKELPQKVNRMIRYEIRCPVSTAL
jgi:hypothetical protein